MPVAIDDIVRINVVVSFRGQEYENVHHFITVANGTADDTAFMAAMQTVLASVYGNAQNKQSDLLRYERIEGQNITQDVLLPQTNWVGNPPGNSAFNPLPPQNSANVFFPTLRPRTRCTVYLPGFTEESNDLNGNWDAGTIVDLQAFGDELVGDRGFGGMVVRKGAYNAPLDRFTELINAVVPIAARTQRRRRIGVGS